MLSRPVSPHGWLDFGGSGEGPWPGWLLCFGKPVKGLGRKEGVVGLLGELGVCVLVCVCAGGGEVWGSVTVVWWWWWVRGGGV